MLHAAAVFPYLGFQKHPVRPNIGKSHEKGDFAAAYRGLHPDVHNAVLHRGGGQKHISGQPLQIDCAAARHEPVGSHEPLRSGFHGLGRNEDGQLLRFAEFHQRGKLYGSAGKPGFPGRAAVEKYAGMGLEQRKVHLNSAAAPCFRHRYGAAIPCLIKFVGGFRLRMRISRRQMNILRRDCVGEPLRIGPDARYLEPAPFALRHCGSSGIVCGKKIPVTVETDFSVG